MKLLAMLAAAIALAGCGKAKPGDSCNNPQCEDSKTAFFCENGIYRSIPCRGTQGCSTSSPGDTVEVICDETFDQAGDNCSADQVSGVICGETPPNALQCTGGEVWTAVTCPMGKCASGPPGVGFCM